MNTKLQSSQGGAGDQSQPSAFSLQPSALMSAKPAHRAGFTLIEMLVVVIIISILAGMVLGLFKIAGVWAAKSQTNERLGKVRAAIEEFHAEYGKYPPVAAKFYDGHQEFRYEHPFTNGWSSVAFQNIRTADPDWSTAHCFTFGLMSFLVTRYAGHADHSSDVYNQLFSLSQWTEHNLSMADQPRDAAAVNRWRVHLEGVIGRHYQPQMNSIATYTNLYWTVRDGWGNELHYSSPRPNTSYRLWSTGPDGIDGTSDDLSTGPGW
jgi:prepilin-type N-terminal cleavage/methylation domain-containing protein